MKIKNEVAGEGLERETFTKRASVWIKIAYRRSVVQRMRLELIGEVKPARPSGKRKPWAAGQAGWPIVEHLQTG